MVTTLDFYSVANLQHTYTQLAPKISLYKEYTLALIMHLEESKLWHWDIKLRQYSSKSLAVILGHIPDWPLSHDGSIGEAELSEHQKAIVAHAYTRTFPLLAKHALSTNVFQRHGALLALSEVIAVLPPSATTARLLGPVLSILTQLHAKRLYRGRGGEQIRRAVCLIIRALAIKGVELPPEISLTTLRGPSKVETHQFLLEFMEECWKQPPRVFAV